MNLATVRAYSMAIRFGSKYAYQTIPRLLTLWLDMGEDAHLSTSDVYMAINTEIEAAIKLTPSYKVRYIELVIIQFLHIFSG